MEMKMVCVRVPLDWRNAYVRAALNEGVTLTTWITDRLNTTLPSSVQSSLSDRSTQPGRLTIESDK